MTDARAIRGTGPLFAALIGVMLPWLGCHTPVALTGNVPDGASPLPATGIAPSPAGNPEGSMAFEENELWGFKTADGRVAIPPRFTLAEDFSSSGMAAVVDEQGWAYINRQGKVLVRPFVFDNGPDPFSEGVARFAENGKYGFFDEAGTIVIPPTFDFALPFENGEAQVCSGCRRVDDGEHWRMEGGTWWAIDHRGQKKDAR